MMSVEQDKEELILDDVPDSGERSFEEFVHFDENTVAAGALTDEEILTEVIEDESLEAGLNNDEIEDVQALTRTDAVLMRYFQQHSGTGDDTVTTLLGFLVTKLHWGGVVFFAYKIHF